MKDEQYFRNLITDPQKAELKGKNALFINHLLSILIESSCDYVCVLNAGFEILVVNKKFCDKVGYQFNKDLKIGE